MPSRLIGNKWLISIPVMLAALTAVLDASIVNVAIPNMQSSFGAGVDEIDWVITGYLISNVIIIPTTGWLSSVFGLRNYFIMSQILFVVASVMCGFSWSLGSLIFFRIIQGIGGGAILPVTLTILLEAFPPQEFAMASALYGVGATLGPAIGPSLGGYLTDAFSWPWIFFVNVPLVALSLFFTFLFIRENRDVTAGRASAPIDYWGLAFVAVWLGTLQVVLQEGQKDDWFQSPFIFWMSFVSLLSFVAFIFVELTEEHPLINIKVFKNRNFTLGSVAGAMLGAALFGMLFLVPLFTGDLLNYTALQIGLLLLPAALVSLVCFPLVGRISSFVDARILIFTGLGLFATALYLQSKVDLSVSYGELMWIQILRGASLPFMFTSIGAISLTTLKPSERADGSSLFNLTRTLGGSFGIAILATFLVNRQRYHFERFGEAISQYSHATQSQLAAISAGFVARGGSDAVTASHQALMALSGRLSAQAFSAAFQDASLMLGVALFATVFMIPFFKPTPRGSQARPAPAE
ncbi:MAG: DHA2 family efflux MFS transporter permease subunit [Candidatus Eremiobacteraeota bacterium]|nr:DHA2 family efflux MFS transporter permease subunit [Candidatus Eremiobacteraeota bacterium]